MAKKTQDVERYQSIPVMQIRIVERPAEGEEPSKLFFNPRSLQSFRPEEMANLMQSIRTEGLQQPPIVREVESGVWELVAGERRLRSIQRIVQEKLPCLDEDAARPKKWQVGSAVVSKGRFGTVKSQSDDTVTIACDDGGTITCKSSDVSPTIPGDALYQSLTCRILTGCDDGRALRVAFAENGQSEPLTTAEEIALVERLEARGHKLDEIAEILGTNITWVSQTANFRSQLPPEAFQKLLFRQMSRNAAVTILSYAPEDREKLLAASIEVERETTAKVIAETTEAMVVAEDEEELARADVRRAQQEGNFAAAKRDERKAAAAAKRAEKAAEKLNRAKNSAGVITQGSLRRAAAKTGINPKKTKALEKDEIRVAYVEGIADYLDGKMTDPETGNVVPGELAAIVRQTALAIIAGRRDALTPIREYMFELGIWERPDMDEQPVAAGAPQKRGRKKSTPQPDIGFEDDDLDLDMDQFEPSSVDDLDD